MTDLLYVSFDKDEITKETGLCVGRTNKDGSLEILKMELDDQADILYKILIDQSAKAIQLKVVEQIRAEIKQTYEQEKEIDKKWAAGLRYSLKIIDKVIKEQSK